MGLLEWPHNMATQSPPERVIQEVKTEAAMFVTPRTKNYTLLLPQYPIGHIGYHTRVYIPGGIYIYDI